MRLASVILLLVIFNSSCKNDPADLSTAQPDLQLLQSPAGDSCAEPYLFSDKNGTVYLSWIEKIKDSASLKFARFQDNGWSAPATIATGKNWFVNWADYPMITADGKNMAAHFLEKSGTGTFAYDIQYTSSADSGRSWSRPVKLNGDDEQAEHGFVSLMPTGDNFFASWLDGRNTSTVANKGSTAHQGHSMAHGGAMSLRAAVLNGSKKLDEWELDNRVCDCCQTAVAQTLQGPVVVYRDRSDNETRDIAIARFVNGVWQKPSIIFADNWQIDGCPVNGPRIDAIDNNLAIAWFTTINKVPEVKVIFSDDGGANFAAPIRIDEGKTIGRVDIVMLDASSAMVSWMEAAEIRSARVFADGKKTQAISIANSAASRSAGFPQMTKSGTRIFYAWTDGNYKRIKTAVLNIGKSEPGQ